MSAPLAYAEALRAAVRVEENGSRFYRKAAAAASNPDAAEVFTRLAVMEEEHKGYFSALSVDLEQRESLFANDPGGTFSARINELADSGVSKWLGEPAAGPGSSWREAVEFAIAMEKDSVIFYLGLQEAVVDREEADKMALIIREEMGHIAALARLLKNSSQR